VAGVSDSPNGIGVHGIGSGIGGEFETSTTGGYILLGLTGGVPQFSVDNVGNLNVNGAITTASQLSLPATTNATTGVITLGGFPFAHSFGVFNIFLGAIAGNFTMTGVQNTAIGLDALFSNTMGSQNAASGTGALEANTMGSENSASGACALSSNTTGISNTASGFAALRFNTTGTQNTSIGMNALENNTTGSNNIGVGFNAGANATIGSSNIYLGNSGTSADANTMRLGSLQTRTFIAGISGVTTGMTGVPVLVDSNGQLGTISSSRRFKYDIDDMGEASSELLQLRPVTFRYKRAQADGSHPLQYGLIAEEVAKVYPQLVQYSTTGELNTVLYHELPALLLNEVQKQHAQIETQIDQLKVQAAQLDRLQSRLEELEAGQPAQ
jgi:hypothetical protein